MSVADYFEQIYQEPDPFQYRNRWYEARKRALTLACLPRQRYRSAWEVGCSNGVLTAELAGRCDELLATDLNAAALADAAETTYDRPNVRLAQASHPGQWPEGRFDLIVVSEVGYYLAPQDVVEMAAKLRASLTDDGLLLACHWLHPFDEARSSALQVHRTFARGLEEAFCYQDADLLMQGWGTGLASVAQQEGLR
ncbi:methyltransferase [uncultured Stenotrophomonas sp.]|uniref:methyltransferase n=1 Tax=uncultured Stenotrophomonas sp. TaxID=165438 RepID=UPI0028EB83D2|nr:methyltransferase [uncultured Stenotrophomonas sp.]